MSETAGRSLPNELVCGRCNRREGRLSLHFSRIFSWLFCPHQARWVTLLLWEDCRLRIPGEWWYYAVDPFPIGAGRRVARSLTGKCFLVPIGLFGMHFAQWTVRHRAVVLTEFCIT